MNIERVHFLYNLGIITGQTHAMIQSLSDINNFVAGAKYPELRAQFNTLFKAYNDFSGSLQRYAKAEIDEV